MADEELTWATDQIMTRGAAIYGCALPKTDYLAQFIGEEIVTIINEFGFSEYTLEEILLAMRVNAVANDRWLSGNETVFVDFSGVSFNTKFLTAVLTIYSKMRDMLNRKIQNHIDGY